MGSEEKKENQLPIRRALVRAPDGIIMGTKL
jgi:hypothetical protein